jgi:N-methylhydantoinase A
VRSNIQGEGHHALIVIGVDTGGTFTDVFTSDGRLLKLPSMTSNPAAAVLQGLRRIGLQAGDAVAHGTTVATNTVLERKGARTALLTSSGFEDVLEIRRQNRPSLYDLLARWPNPLVPRELRFGLNERFDHRGYELSPMDEAHLEAVVDAVTSSKVEAVAVCLLFSYVRPDHELRVGEHLARRNGSEFPVSLSHRIAPQYGEFERTSTTVVNAYVMPLMRLYLQTLDRGVRELGATRFHVMHSNGGLVSAATAGEFPVGAILSGPAAGVVGAQRLASQAGREHIVTFDMGGTSTDVAVIPGEVLERDDGEVDAFPLLIPMLRIETVGAGGGSIARLDSGGGIHVGPQSAGADPGPAAYGKGTLPTVSDANLVLGRLSPSGLLGGSLPLEVARSRAALQCLAKPLELTTEQAAWAVVRLANSNMERAVRTVTLQRGHDPRRFALFAFGGAGPLHAVDLADGLGITEILIPPHPGVMAALGLTVPDLRRDFYKSVLHRITEESESRLQGEFGSLEAQARDELASEDTRGFGKLQLQRLVDVRYVGQSFELRLPYLRPLRSLLDSFARLHHQRYGYSSTTHQVEIVHLRVRATLPRIGSSRLVPAWPEAARPSASREVWFGSSTAVTGLEAVETAVIWRPTLPPGSILSGPAVLEQYDTVTILPPGWVARVDERFNLWLNPSQSS